MTHSTILLFTRSMIMVTLSSSAKITISDSKPDSPAAFPFFNILFESPKRDAPLAVSF